jgi:hypothetical protein
MVTGVRHNEQPGDLEAGEGAFVTIITVHSESFIFPDLVVLQPEFKMD